MARLPVRPAPGALSSAIEGRGRYLRPTTTRAMAGRGQNISIEVLGLRDAQRIPEHLARTYERMMIRLENDLQTAARAVVPGKSTGRLAMQVHARRVGSRIVIGTVGSQFARALNRGFTSTPKKARALRFDDGGEVFTMRVKVAGRHFFEKWIALTDPIVESTYASSFYNIRDWT